MDQRHDFPGELPVIPSGLSGGEIDLVPGEGFVGILHDLLGPLARAAGPLFARVEYLEDRLEENRVDGNHQQREEHD